MSVINKYKGKDIKIIVNDIFTKYLGDEGRVLASKIMTEMNENDPIYVISNHIERLTRIVERLRDLKYLLSLEARWRCPACGVGFASICNLLRHILVSNDERHKKLRSKFELLYRKTKLTRVSILKDLIWIEF